MKTGTDRKYTAEFRDSAVKQVTQGGRGMAAVARSLEMSTKTLANWVYLARKGQALVKPRPAQPVSEVEAGVSDVVRSDRRDTAFGASTAVASATGTTAAATGAMAAFENSGMPALNASTRTPASAPCPSMEKPLPMKEISAFT